MRIMPFIFTVLTFLLTAFRIHAQDQPVAVTGGTILTITKGTIESGTIVFHQGKITAVGPADAVSVPDQAEVIDASGKIVMPGLVDTHSHIGIYPLPPVRANSDGNEMSGPVQSGLRAMDAIWPDDPGIRSALAGGITTANIMPGSGNAVGGQTAYVKLHGRTIEDMLIDNDGIAGGMKMANGENPKGVYGPKGHAPSTRMAIAALQRDLFIRAQAYQKKQNEYRSASEKERKEMDPPARDLDLEPVVEILEGRRTVHFHTHRADDIITILRLKKEFGFDLVLQHVTEGYKVADEIAAAGAAASIIVIDSPGGKHEAADYSIINGGVLEKAGVHVAIHTDDFIVDSRQFLRTAALMVRGGMSERGALEALTINPARMMRLDDRIGSLETGKDADIIILSGPPFRVMTHVLQTFIDGKPVFDRSRPEDLRYATGGYQVRERYPEMGGGQ